MIRKFEVSQVEWVCYIEVCGLYATVARQAGLVPSTQPVAVLREGRVYDGCRAAFASGLALGAPARQVQRDVPGAVQVELGELEPAVTAHAWWDQCLSHTPFIEPAEPHQIYLSLPSPGMALTAAIRNEVAQLVDQAATYGFVAFAGVASSKVVARAAALVCKAAWLLRRPGSPGHQAAPETTAFVLPGEEERYLAPLPTTYLPAAPEVQRRLGRLGVRTLGEIAQIPAAEWGRQLGPAGQQIAEWSHGVDREPVKPCYPPRSLQRRVSFAQDLRDRDRLELVVSRLAAALAGELTARGEGCQQVALTLEEAGGRRICCERTLAKLQQSVRPLQQALYLLLEQILSRPSTYLEGAKVSPQKHLFFQEPTEAATGVDGRGHEVAVSALWVELRLIGPMPWQQLNLWDDSGRSEREERLERALLLLHERFPSHMVGLGPRYGLTWKEQMLQFNDPYRWAGHGVGPSWPG